MGKIKPNSPDCSVDVVEETTILFSWAFTPKAKTANRALINKFEMSFFMNVNK
jgi:hypothetical protein